jgi:tetratricopeptide (TPR) repeat protein
MSARIVRGIVPLITLIVGVAHAETNTSFDAGLAHIQQQWAIANYQITSKNEKLQAFEALSAETHRHRFSAENPQRAEPLIWEGIVLSTYAGAKGGVGALGLAKKSRAVLEAALKIDDKALDGSAYTSLATLYAKVPGFPLGFGDDDKAQDLFVKALTINPYGVDPNYFYAQYLCDRHECRDALRYLQRAADAPPRPGRELADEGRHREVEELMAKAR